MTLQIEKIGNAAFYWETGKKPAAFTLKTNKVYARDKKTAERIKAHFPEGAEVRWLSDWNKTFRHVVSRAKKGEAFQAVRFVGGTCLSLENGNEYDMVGEDGLDGIWRVIDETWEDYGFSSCCFSPVERKGFFD